MIQNARGCKFNVETDQKKQIGDRLALVRATKRMSQKAMGEFLAIPWRTYQNYETGSREMPVGFAVRYCEKLDIRIEWLIEGKGGQNRVDGISAIRPILLETDSQARSTGDALPIEALADIAVRLLKKQLDGQMITDQDYKDYIELKRET